MRGLIFKSHEILKSIFAHPDHIYFHLIIGRISNRLYTWVLLKIERILRAISQNSTNIDPKKSFAYRQFFTLSISTYVLNFLCNKGLYSAIVEISH